MAKDLARWEETKRRTKQGLLVTGLSSVLFARTLTIISRATQDRYNFGKNKIITEYFGPSLEWYDKGQTRIRFADGTKTNIPYAMNPDQIASFLLENPEHSYLKEERK
jgi:hypothetical protein